MSLRKEQCKKVCRILDDVLANRPTERDSLIVAVQLAFEALTEPHWIPVTERLPEKSGRYYVTEWVYHIDDKKHEGKHTKRVNFAEYSATEKKWRRAQALVVVAWMDNEPYKGVTE